MNKSKIDWCDFSWNPVTGCRTGCEYCYAAKQAKRFSGDVRINKGSGQLRRDENGLYILDNPFKNQGGKVIPCPAGFEPTLHRYRLPMPAQKKKPANITTSVYNQGYIDGIRMGAQPFIHRALMQGGQRRAPGGKARAIKKTIM